MQLRVKAAKLLRIEYLLRGTPAVGIDVPDGLIGSHSLLRVAWPAPARRVHASPGELATATSFAGPLTLGYPVVVAVRIAEYLGQLVGRPA